MNESKEVALLKIDGKDNDNQTLCNSLHKNTCKPIIKCFISCEKNNPAKSMYSSD